MVFLAGLGGSGFTAFWPGFYSFFASFSKGFFVLSWLIYMPPDPVISAITKGLFMDEVYAFLLSFSSFLYLSKVDFP